MGRGGVEAVFRARFGRAGVDVDQRGLQQMQSEHGHFGVFAVGAGESAVLAVEDHRVRGVPVLHDLQAAVDLAAELRIREVVAGEHRPNGPAELFQCLVGGVFASAAA